MNQLVLRSSTPALPAEAADRLRAWTAAAQDALAANTQRAYAADSRVFSEWCAAQGLASLPAAPSTVASYLRAEAEAGRAVATIRRRLATIAKMHKAAGLANPAADELVRLALKGIARVRGTDQRQAAALSERDAVTIRAHMGDEPRDLRDLALLLAGRDLLARSAELVTIQVEDIEFSDDGALVSLRRHKTTTERQSYYIGAEAAQAVRAWLDRAGIVTGPVFQSVTRSGRPTGTALDTRDVRRILKDRARQAKLAHADQVSGHSVRVGMCQDLVAAGLDVAAVAQSGGWASLTMVSRYSSRIAARRGAVARYYSRG
jgi:site-specific recombinase XerD